MPTLIKITIALLVSLCAAPDVDRGERPVCGCVDSSGNGWTQDCSGDAGWSGSCTECCSGHGGQWELISKPVEGSQ